MQNETTDDYTLRKADARDLPRLRGYFEGLSDVARRNRFHVPLKASAMNWSRSCSVARIVLWSPRTSATARSSARP